MLAPGQLNPDAGASDFEVADHVQQQMGPGLADGAQLAAGAERHHDHVGDRLLVRVEVQVGGVGDGAALLERG